MVNDMTDKRTFLPTSVFLLIGIVLLSGCLKPKIITDSLSLNVTATTTNASAFIEAGCVKDINWGNNGLDCSSIGLEERFSCEHIEIPADLGGLSPNVPIVECTFISKNLTSDADEGIVREGCLRPEFRRYIVIKDSEYKLIGSKEEFIRLFAPVESQQVIERNCNQMNNPPRPESIAQEMSSLGNPRNAHYETKTEPPQEPETG